MITPQPHLEVTFNLPISHELREAFVKVDMDEGITDVKYERKISKLILRALSEVPFSQWEQLSWDCRDG